MAEQLPVIMLIAPLFGALPHRRLAGPGDPRRAPRHPRAVHFPGRGHRPVVPGRLAARSITSSAVGRPLGIGIELRVDGLNGLLLVAIATVGLLSAVFSHRRAGENPDRKPHSSTCSFCSCCAACSGITITGDAFNLYVLVEICVASPVTALSRWVRRAVLAAFNYLVMGTIGASLLPAWCRISLHAHRRAQHGRHPGIHRRPKDLCVSHHPRRLHAHSCRRVDQRWPFFPSTAGCRTPTPMPLRDRRPHGAARHQGHRLCDDPHDDASSASTASSRASDGATPSSGFAVVAIVAGSILALSRQT